MTLFITRDAEPVTDAIGHTWNTGDIYATLLTVNLFGPVTLALLAVVKLLRGDIAARTSTAP